MRHERDVALLTLLIRHAWQNRWEDLDSIIVDQGIAPGELSWFSMLAAHQLTEDAWRVIRVLNEPADFTRWARELSATDPLRAEALLHAVEQRNARWAFTKWAAPYTAPERWRRVQQFMKMFEEEGIGATRDDIEAIASWAWRAVTGEPLDRYADSWAS